MTQEEFAKLVETGAVQAETLVWREGMAGWLPYGQVSGQKPVAAGGAVEVEGDSAVCAVSGQRRPKRDMLEFEGRWVSAEHKEAFFQRLREGVAPVGEMVYAGFWPRVGAKIIDSIIVGVVNVGVAVVAGGLMGAIFASSMDNPNTAIAVALGIQAVTQVTGILIALFYSIYFIRKQDATPGKRLLGLKVLRADGSSLTKGRIVGRYFAEIVSSITLLIGYLMVAFDKEERRALHDRICDTRVVKVR